MRYKSADGYSLQEETAADIDCHDDLTKEGQKHLASNEWTQGPTMDPNPVSSYRRDTM